MQILYVLPACLTGAAPTSHRFLFPSPIKRGTPAPYRGSLVCQPRAPSQRSGQGPIMDARGTARFLFFPPSFVPSSATTLLPFFPFFSTLFLFPLRQRGDPFFHRVRHYGPLEYPPSPGPRTSDQTTEYKAKRVKRNANRRNVGT